MSAVISTPASISSTMAPAVSPVIPPMRLTIRTRKTKNNPTVVNSIHIPVIPVKSGMAAKVNRITIRLIR